MSNLTAEDPRSDEFLLANKRFYLDVEEYDWVEATDRFTGLESLFHRLRQRTMRSVIRKHGTPPFLDAACGTGLILRHLPTGSIGVDINPRNLPKASRYASGAQLANADIEALPYGDGSFGTIIATEVLEHLPNPEVALAELWRALKPGGKLLGTVPNDSPVWKLRFLSSSCPGEEPYHKNYRRAELRDLLAGRFDRFSVRMANATMTLLFIAGKAPASEHR